jgi:flagellar basal body-associated protein FliL
MDSREPNEGSAGSTRMLWAIVVVVSVLCGSLGFALARSFAGPRISQHCQSNELDRLKARKVDGSAMAAKSWYFDLGPVVANLNDPGITRHAFVALTLEIAADIDQDKGRVFLDKNSTWLTSWLTVYLEGLPVQEATGGQNLNRIQSHILDAFNEKLFPDSEPYIKRVLFKEFTIR